MKTIWKFKLVHGQTTIKAPVEKFLCVKLQRGIITVWAEIDLSKESKSYELNIYGTGWELRDLGEYIGTVLECEDSLVWHVYAKEK